MASNPFMGWFNGLEAVSPFYYIPFYTPSAAVGGLMGVMVYFVLKRSGLLNRIMSDFE